MLQIRHTFMSAAHMSVLPLLLAVRIGSLNYIQCLCFVRESRQGKKQEGRPPVLSPGQPWPNGVAG
jgi:hypothetical protein